MQKEIEGLNGSKCPTQKKSLTHYFVDDVLLFGKGTEENLRVYASVLEKYKKATGMVINIDKSWYIMNFQQT